MDLTIQAVLIIATFSLAHERVIEFVRWWIDKIPSAAARDVIGAFTKGAWAWLPAIALSIVTNANLIDAFRVGADHQPVFFADYLHGPPSDFKAVVGCCLMGLAVTLGSSFWHDFAKGLIEIRGRLQLTPQQQLARTPLPAAPRVPADSGLVPA